MFRATSINSGTTSSRFPLQVIKDFPPIIVCQYANKGEIKYEERYCKTQAREEDNAVYV